MGKTGMEQPRKTLSFNYIVTTKCIANDTTTLVIDE